MSHPRSLASYATEAEARRGQRLVHRRVFPDARIRSATLRAKSANPGANPRVRHVRKSRTTAMVQQVPQSAVSRVRAAGAFARPSMTLSQDSPECVLRTRTSSTRCDVEDYIPWLRVENTLVADRRKRSAARLRLHGPECDSNSGPRNRNRRVGHMR
jgi:hypothetical protein